MRIREQTAERMVVTRGSLFDRAFFSIFVLVGGGMFVFADRLDEPRWPWLGLAAAFIAGGLYFWRLSATITLTLDRHAGEARLDWVQVHRRTSRAVPLGQIVALTVEEGHDADRLVFQLADGSTLPLVGYSYTGGDEPEIREAVNAWLGERADASARRPRA